VCVEKERHGREREREKGLSLGVLVRASE